jgi:lipopolysaccharide biosynthesis protein
MSLRPIAFYLPQFHPIPENDEWWGNGFTEWMNVKRAVPLFEGHYQPHVPAELGYYDLRNAAVREAQADMAREHGIYGFCYYHYWFNGRRVLERPFNEVLESGSPDFPFMLCWANENWTRVWDGSAKDVLLEQHYSEEDNIAHIRSLLPAFKDPRYICANGKPVFAVYRSGLVPDTKSMLACWRNEAAKEGLELYLCRMETFGDFGASFLEDGFDAAIDFEPFGEKLELFTRQEQWKKINNKLSAWYLAYKLASAGKRQQMLQQVRNRPDYTAYVDFVLKQPPVSYKRFPGITPMWDNTARRNEGAFLFTNPSPVKYREWLQHELEQFKPYSPEENFIFINAWNEWAEGNHLEPCLQFGTQFLSLGKSVFEKYAPAITLNHVKKNKHHGY